MRDGRKPEASSAAPPRWLLFDLNGTLLDPTALAGAWDGGNEGVATALAALDDAVGQAMADTIVGEFRPFPEYLGAALERRVPKDSVEEALEIAKSMPAFDGAAEVLQQLSGVTQVGVLTNSATKSANEAVKAAGLAESLTIVIGADEVGRYRPHPEVYAHALSRLGAEPGDVMLAAAHWWDVHGAKRAGLRTCWIGHKEEHLLSTVDPPDATVAALSELPAALAG